jgi:hypothetical protein
MVKKKDLMIIIRQKMVKKHTDLINTSFELKPIKANQSHVTTDPRHGVTLIHMEL